jgi:hypothetical protein
MKNNSSLYVSATQLHASLVSQLENIQNYLSEGSATSTVKYYDKKGKLLKTWEYTSKWSTSVGRQKVATMHVKAIKEITNTFSIKDVARVSVMSPFVGNQTDTIVANTIADITVQKFTI